MNLITAISFNAATAIRAERIADCVYWQSGRQPVGHCLLIAEHGTHDEFKTKVSIAAEVGFQSVELITATPGENLLVKAMMFIADNYKYPWVYLEPNCAPLVPDWRQQLLSMYDAQPKRYFGPHLRAGEKMMLSRVAVYPPNAATDLGKDLLPLSIKSRAIQRMTYDGDDSKIRDDAVLLDNDPSGLLVEKLIDRTSTTVEITPPKRRRGRPRNTGLIV